MNITIENILLVGSILLFISIIIGRISYKYGIPTLLLFLGIGMLAGSEGLGGIIFDNSRAAQFIGVFALNFILFSGGLQTNIPTIRPILWQGILLSTVGVFVTAITLGLFVWLLFDFTFYESMLLGSIVSSTDAAAVFSILRFKNLKLNNNLSSILEFESGSNDPMAYVLVTVFLSLVTNENQGFLFVVPMFLLQIIIGVIAGFVFGIISKYLFQRVSIGYDGLYPVLAIALMFITFSVTQFFYGNGFLSIYICAIFLGNNQYAHKRDIIKMYDGLTWLMQIILFITLGMLVFPSQIIPVAGVGLLISLFLIFVARPLSVFVALSPFAMSYRSRLYISWTGLRGAVPIVFATYPLLAGISQAQMIFNIVFFISVSSVLIQGTTLGIFAKWLKLQE